MFCLRAAAPLIASVVGLNGKNKVEAPGYAAAAAVAAAVAATATAAAGTCRL